MEEYADEEIGELDQDDPELCGTASLEIYDQMMDEFLAARHVSARRQALEEYRSGWREGERQQEPKKDDGWDAETILSTYSTTDNHPKTVRIERRPNSEHIQLHPTSGLPVGIVLPGSKALPNANRQAVNSSWDFDDEAADDGEDVGELVNLGAARPREERGEEKRQRKQAAKKDQQARREQKKETKLAFKGEKSKQLQVQQKTTRVQGINLSRQVMGLESARIAKQ